MARASTGKRRGASTRSGRTLKIAVGALLVLLVLMILNAFALNNETGSAKLTIPDAELVQTSAGKLQVLDTGAPTGKDSLTDFVQTGSAVDDLPYVGLMDVQQSYHQTPIVLVHGSAGAINWWDELIPLLRKGHRVIAVDMLGYGGSDKPDSDYSIETQARLVAEVLAKLEVERAILVGHSLGGKVVTSVAEQSPDLVAGLTVIDTGPDNSYGGLSGGAKASRTPLLGQAMWRIAPDFMIRRNISQGFAPDFNVADKYVDDVRAMTYQAYKESAVKSEEFTDTKPLPERIEALGIPLLVMFGEEDQLYDARDSISAFAAIPGVETLLIPEIGHSPQVEAPEQTAQAINSFAYKVAKKEAVTARRQAVREARLKAQAKAKARATARAKARTRAKLRADRQKARNHSGRQSQKNQRRQKARNGR